MQDAIFREIKHLVQSHASNCSNSQSEIPDFLFYGVGSEWCRKGHPLHLSQVPGDTARNHAIKVKQYACSADTTSRQVLSYSQPALK